MLTFLLATALLSQSDPSQTTNAPPPPKWVKPDAELGAALNDTKTAFLDKPGGRVWLKTFVVQREAPLEMFLCKRGTKEHEAVLSVDSPAFVIHGGLIALGLQPGTPARYVPPEGDASEGKNLPPTGPKLDLIVHWAGKDGKPSSRPAEEWVRTATNRWWAAKLPASATSGIDLPEDIDVRYDRRDEELLHFDTLTEADRDRLLRLSDDEAFRAAVNAIHEKSQPSGMNAEWVFAGSGFIENPTTNERMYLAEGGTLVCVANFGEAMIDVATVSSASNDYLLYVPWEGRVPEVGTPVLLEIRPSTAS